MKNLTKQDIDDILNGCVILGTGGGGDVEEGYEYINEAMCQGKEFILADVDEVPNDALICTPYLLGAISCEMGGANTAVAFYVAAMMDGYIIDADPAGRAVPEITHSTYYISGLPVGPIVMANEFGEHVIIENVIDDERAEDLARALAVESRNDISVIDHAMEMKELRHAIIRGATSYALSLGRAFREAKQKRLDVVEKVAESGKGFVAFRGRVKACDWKTKSGFTIGHVIMEGVGRYHGHEYQIDYKNEHMISRLDNRIHSTIPELICLFDSDTNEPITNPHHKVGMNVAVIILPAPEAFLTEKGLGAFGPNYLGLSIAFQPAQDQFKE